MGYNGMKCQICGNDNPNGGNFCSHCGEKINTYNEYTGQTIKKYLISIYNQQSGPYTISEIIDSIKKNNIGRDWYISEEGSNTWIKIYEIPELNTVLNEQDMLNYNASAKYYQQHNNEERKLRNGFTSFWLWINLIFSGFGTISMLFVFFFEDYLKEIIQNIYPTLNSNIWFYWCMGISIVTTLGLWKIIKHWKKSGFYYIVVSAIASIILVYVYFPDQTSTAFISCSMFPLLTFLIMKIHNSYNAKTTWEQME